ncbi:MAG: hypothetical protein HOV81_42905 [Kofleriaceae bacterium]|nr:hypothetical protein [Kofleriaceae bacterium]
MAKDRAAPFSKKHRRYWLPVTGGMLLIGAINVAIGMATYDEPQQTQRMELKIPGHERKPGELRRNEIPPDVMRAFAVKYPRTIPDGAQQVSNDTIVVKFPAGAAHAHATFKVDGTFVSDD